MTRVTNAFTMMTRDLTEVAYRDRHIGHGSGTPGRRGADSPAELRTRRDHEDRHWH